MHAWHLLAYTHTLDATLKCFHGQVKAKALNLLKNNKEIIDFLILYQEWDFSADLVEMTEALTLQVYVLK